MYNNIKTENRYTELLIFVREQIGEYNMSITRDSLVENDLGVTGDDAADLIMAFSKKYNVDIGNFNFTKYFYDEPGIFNFQNRIIEPFTIGHLEKAIIAGNLDEEVIWNS